MSLSGLNFGVEIPDVQLAAYEAAIRAGDLASLKQVLLASCLEEQRLMIERLLPVQLVQAA